ncbi:hypothetical protein Ancab_014697 [Ancistrocladus abbreviatus]
MEDTKRNEELEYLSTGVYELPGEPAVIINGVPNIASSNGMLVSCNSQSVSETPRRTGFGEWLEGREVKKMFGDQYYSGTVTNYDKETGWYRVVYEDGDYEDLEWHEMREVLQPLDITVPLRTLALKLIKKGQKLSHGSGKKVVKSRNTMSTSGRGRGRP